jgi:hypothetical protein
VQRKKLINLLGTFLKSAAQKDLIPFKKKVRQKNKDAMIRCHRPLTQQMHLIP